LQWSCLEYTIKIELLKGVIKFVRMH